jgi:hypothetical protein
MCPLHGIPLGKQVFSVLATVPKTEQFYLRIKPSETANSSIQGW